MIISNLYSLGFFVFDFLKASANLCTYKDTWQLTVFNSIAATVIQQKNESIYYQTADMLWMSGWHKFDDSPFLLLVITICNPLLLITAATHLIPSDSANKTLRFPLTISPSSTTFSPLTMNIPLGMSPNFFPTWMRSTVWWKTKFAGRDERKRLETCDPCSTLWIHIYKTCENRMHIWTFM